MFPNSFPGSSFIFHFMFSTEVGWYLGAVICKCYLHIVGQCLFGNFVRRCCNYFRLFGLKWYCLPLKKVCRLYLLFQVILLVKTWAHWRSQSCFCSYHIWQQVSQRLEFELNVTLCFYEWYQMLCSCLERVNRQFYFLMISISLLSLRRYGKRDFEIGRCPWIVFVRYVLFWNNLKCIVYSA